jgi:uncharacterized protein (DUF169 family)
MATSSSDLAGQLRDLLALDHPPVAVSIDPAPPADLDPLGDASRSGDANRSRDPDPFGDAHPFGDGGPGPVPAGCCFWEPAQRAALTTTAADHANCSVGSYTHGFVELPVAAAGADTAALVGSGWVSEADLMAAPHLPLTPSAIRYEPFDGALDPDVVLVRLTPAALMTLQGAVPRLRLVTRPQCQIVPLAFGGESTVSPGCAVSRARTDLPAGELTCALPAAEVPTIVDRLVRAVEADRAVAAYAAADRERFDRPTD